MKTNNTIKEQSSRLGSCSASVETQRVSMRAWVVALAVVVFSKSVGIGQFSDGTQITSSVYSEVNGAGAPTSTLSAVYYAPATSYDNSFSVSTAASFAPASNAVPGIDASFVSRITNAQQNLSPASLPNIDSAKQRLVSAMQILQSFLGTSPQHGNNWLTFLRWNELNAELSKPSPDLDRLTQIEKNMRQNYLGLELAPFTAVRDSLGAYIEAVRFASDPAKTIDILNKRLALLSDKLQSPSGISDFESVRDLEQTVSFLAQSHQATELANAIKSRFARPNLRVLISDEYVRRRFTRPVYETNPVDEVILGTRILGTSLLTGFVSPQLLDSSRNASLRLTLSGNFSSNNTGYNRSVQLHTTGAANVVACETLALTDSGFVQLNDASADANLMTQINSIDAKLGIVRKIAAKQAAKQKPEADAIGESRLENRIRDQFHQQLGLQLNEANAKLRSPDTPVLARLGLTRPGRTTWSSIQYLAMLWNVQSGAQLSAPNSCPLTVEPTGITLQLHQSAVANGLDPILAGRIIKNTEVPALVSQFGELSRGIAKRDNDEPWAITMNSFHPVEIELDDSLLKIRIRTTKLDRGDQALDQAASIEAAYRVSVVDGALQLYREGDVKIDFVGKQQRGVRAVTLRSFLKNKFDEVFKPQLFDTPIRPLDKLPAELQGLGLSSVTIDDGWLQAHLR